MSYKWKKLSIFYKIYLTLNLLAIIHIILSIYFIWGEISISFGMLIIGILNYISIALRTYRIKNKFFVFLHELISSTLIIVATYTLFVYGIHESIGVILFFIFLSFCFNLQSFMQKLLYKKIEIKINRIVRLCLLPLAGILVWFLVGVGYEGSFFMFLINDWYFNILYLGGFGISITFDKIINKKITTGKIEID